MERSIRNSQVFGEVAWLFTQSELHRDWPISSLLRWVIPAISLQQYRIYHQDGAPKGYISWAKLSPDVEREYALCPESLQPKDWNSGDRYWLVDFISPLGHTKEIIKDIKHNIFPDTQGRAIRLYKGKPETRIAYIHGVNISKNIADVVKQPSVDIS